MCFYNYKLMSLLPSSILSWNIGRKTEKLKASMDAVDEISSKLNNVFEQLKKANASLTKLAVQATRFGEKTKLKDMYKQREEAVSRINRTAAFNITKLFNRIYSAVKLLEKIIFNADASLYRESKRLNHIICKISKLDDKKLSQALLNKVELVKEDIKTTARRLYEASRAEETEVLKKYPGKEPKTEVSEEIKKISKELPDIEKSLKQLSVTNISEIYSDSEMLLHDLRKIEFDAIAAMPKLENHLTKINALLYLLENEIRLSVSSRLKSFRDDFKEIKKKITEHAKNLSADIEIVKKINKKRE